MFQEVFPPSIYPALVILAVVAFRVRAFYRRGDYMQIGRAVPELILGAIYLIDYFYPFAPVHRVNLIRNSIILLFVTELFFQVYALPRLRRMNDVAK